MASADLIEWVVYHPAKSQGFGHSSRFREWERSWEATKAFLSGITTASTPGPIELRCRSEDRWLPAEIAMSRRAEAMAVFGAPNDEHEKEAVWNLDASQLENAVAFECSGPKSEEGRLDPSSVRFAYRFSWRNPWPSCAESDLSLSTLGVYISGARLFFQPNFVFVAPINSPEFREQFLSVEAAAPFKFGDANFKRWIIHTKRRDMGRHLNVDRNWRRSWSTN